jgi:hypothetical protein
LSSLKPWRFPDCDLFVTVPELAWCYIAPHMVEAL